MLNRFKKYLTYVDVKLKRDTPLQILYHALNAIGICIQPFYIMKEGLFADVNPYELPHLRSYTVIWFDRGDMGRIAALPDRNTPVKEMAARLDHGDLCLAVVDNDRVVAFTWCNLTWCDYPGYRFRLADDEAYLYDAHTAAAYRGMGVAPFIRYRLYEELALVGRTQLYSFTERFNQAAIRFKQKLNSRIVDTGLFIQLFGRWSVSHCRCHYKHIIRQ